MHVVRKKKRKNAHDLARGAGKNLAASMASVGRQWAAFVVVEGSPQITEVCFMSCWFNSEISHFSPKIVHFPAKKQLLATCYACIFGPFFLKRTTINSPFVHKTHFGFYLKRMTKSCKTPSDLRDKVPRVAVAKFNWVGRKWDIEKKKNLSDIISLKVTKIFFGRDWARYWIVDKSWEDW